MEIEKTKKLSKIHGSLVNIQRLKHELALKQDNNELKQAARATIERFSKASSLVRLVQSNKAKLSRTYHRQLVAVIAATSCSANVDPQGD